MPPKIIISALAENYVIGSQNGLPWDLPEDYQQYLDFVRDKTVIMGRKTYEIFAKDLESRHDLVVTRSIAATDKYRVFNSIEAAITHAEALDRAIFIAGGASIYAQSLPLADEMYLSHVKGTFEGDAFFPRFDVGDWEIVKREPHARFEFVHYRRKV